MDFLNPMNPSGGQFASLSDLITLAQTLLSAHHPKSQLSNHFLQKWLRPIQPLEDDLTEVGLVWEIVKTWDTNGRARRIYQKSKPSYTSPYFLSNAHPPTCKYSG